MPRSAEAKIQTREVFIAAPVGRGPEPSLRPQFLARVAGFLYLGVIVIGLFPYAVLPSMFVSSDLAATVRHIAASQELWKYLEQIGASHVVIGQPWTDSRYILEGFAERNADRLQQVFHNAQFTVYQVRQGIELAGPATAIGGTCRIRTRWLKASCIRSWPAG